MATFYSSKATLFDIKIPCSKTRSKQGIVLKHCLLNTYTFRFSFLEISPNLFCTTREAQQYPSHYILQPALQNIMSKVFV